MIKKGYFNKFWKIQCEYDLQNLRMLNLKSQTYTVSEKELCVKQAEKQFSEENNVSSDELKREIMDPKNINLRLTL